MQRRFFMRCSALGLLAITAAAQDKPAIEAIVKQYILDHPEVLLESVRLHQDRERAAQRERTKQTVLARRNELEQDAASPVAGASGGLTIVEFFDYHCGFCKRAEPAVAKLLADHPEVRVVFKEFPILGPESVLGAKAGLAAARQGRYLQFHQALMTLGGSITMSAIEQIAAREGIDVRKLKSDMESPEIESTLARNRDLGLALGVAATPSFVIGTELISEALDSAAFERLLAKAKNAPHPAPQLSSRNE